jgi:isopentenyl diphosphate isomerase/L-lactate dehydrogenase-like FMN-dependent dehydrogenase
VVIKGIMHPEDAQKCMSCGVDAIIVSNHGGRQLGAARATIDVLPLVASVVANRIPILLDGGVSSGEDILKAITRGASGCLIGRPWVNAIAAGGERALLRMLDLFSREFEAAMALCGFSSTEEAKREGALACANNWGGRLSN